MVRGERRVNKATGSAAFKPAHLEWQVQGKIGVITLSRPERKNPLTFDSYRELVDIFHQLKEWPEITSVVLTGSGGNFCSGGDVHEIIGPLVRMQEEHRFEELLAFTTMTGQLVKAMRDCPQPIIAAVDGVCAGAGAILAMASDIRLGTPRSKLSFLFVRVGLSGADMGACAFLPRIIGHGRASELLYTGRSIDGNEGERWGFFNRLLDPDRLLGEAIAMARELAEGPALAHATTKRCLHNEWNMGINDAIDAEVQEQAACMQTADFASGYYAFVNRSRPRFQGK
jgi:enoyl-CoA hydratase/carnithine racemase